MLGDDFEVVLAGAVAGDEHALTRLYLDTAPLVRGYLASHRAPEVDDLTSDVFVSVMTSLDRFEGDERRFRTWLLTIAHRRMLDGYRRRGRRPEDPVVLGEDGLDVVDGRSGEVEALARLQASGVLAAIDRLTPDQRAVLLLRTVADLPIRDVAEVVGKPESAVKALLRRASASLERQLADDATGDGAG